jgi:hypothetical protein
MYTLNAVSNLRHKAVITTYLKQIIFYVLTKKKGGLWFTTVRFTTLIQYSKTCIHVVMYFHTPIQTVSVCFGPIYDYSNLRRFTQNQKLAFMTHRHSEHSRTTRRSPGFRRDLGRQFRAPLPTKPC